MVLWSIFLYPVNRFVPLYLKWVCYKENNYFCLNFLSTINLLISEFRPFTLKWFLICWPMVRTVNRIYKFFYPLHLFSFLNSLCFFSVFSLVLTKYFTWFYFFSFLCTSIILFWELILIDVLHFAIYIYN